MSADQMRSALMEVYPGLRWRQKVMDMSDGQVIAIYKSMVRDGRLLKHERPQDEHRLY